MAYLQFSPLGQSWQNMARTEDKKAFYVLEFAKNKSVVMVQWRFWTKYHTEPPKDKTIHERYKKFQQSGCLWAVTRTGPPRPSAETVERVWETFVRSTQKSTHRAKLQMPQSSVWHILRKCLHAKGYRLHMLDSLGRWPWPVCSFHSALAATLLEFLEPIMNCFVHRWFCV
jgi:hypothetical protein